MNQLMLKLLYKNINKNMKMALPSQYPIGVPLVFDGFVDRYKIPIS